MNSTMFVDDITLLVRGASITSVSTRVTEKSSHLLNSYKLFRKDRQGKGGGIAFYAMLWLTEEKILKGPT